MNGDVFGRVVVGEHSNQQMEDIIGGEKKIKKSEKKAWLVSLFIRSLGYDIERKNKRFKKRKRSSNEQYSS